MKFNTLKTLLFCGVINTFSFCSSAIEVEVGVQIIVDDNLIGRNRDEADLTFEMNTFIEESNGYFRRSGVDIQLKLENIIFSDISNNGRETNPDTLLNNMRNQRNGFDNIFTTADRTGSDYTVAIFESLDGVCGKAAGVHTSIFDIMRTDRAYAIAEIGCDSDTFVHELGHLMGLAHGDQVEACKGGGHDRAIENFSKGFAFIPGASVKPVRGAGGVTFDNCVVADDGGNYFGTIMVGNHVSPAQAAVDRGTTGFSKVPVFSGPNVRNVNCGETEICGDGENGNAVNALNRLSFFYAIHETRDVDFLEYDDDKLKACIRSGYAGEEIVDLTSLNCSFKNVSNIEGLQQLRALNQIDLSGNNIMNLLPLTEFSNNSITSINLDGNDAALCHQLELLNAQFPSKVVLPDSCFNIGVMVAINNILLK